MVLVEFKNYFGAITTLFDMIKGFKREKIKRLKIYPIHGGIFNEEQFILELNPYMDDFPKKEGKYVMYFPGRKGSYGSDYRIYSADVKISPAEYIADMIFKYYARCDNECFGFGVMFFPRIEESESKYDYDVSNRITRLFTVVD